MLAAEEAIVLAFLSLISLLLGDGTEESGKTQVDEFGRSSDEEGPGALHGGGSCGPSLAWEQDCSDLVPTPRPPLEIPWCIQTPGVKTDLREL